MPGFFSGLVRAASRGAVGAEQGKYEGEQALIARAMKEEEARRLRAQTANYESQISDRANKPPPAYHPSSRGEAEQFYKDTHPTRDTGPVPGSPEWYNMQDRVAGIRASHRAASLGSRPDIPIDKAISQTGQQITSNRADMNSVDRQLKGYEGKETLDRRNVDPADIGQFVADSTQFSSLQGTRRKLVNRGDSLNTARDEMSAERNRVLGLNLGLSPTSPTAGAGGAGEKPKSGVPPEAAALFKEAAEAFRATGDQAKYNKVVAAISKKYGLIH